jgi:predicted TIM-barrel fold metal-dependent hydrolase
MAMAQKHENVYCDCSAWLPSTWDPEFVNWIDSWGRNKTMFGTNSVGFKRCRDQFMQLSLRDDTKQKVLRDNAVKVFKL